MPSYVCKHPLCGNLIPERGYCEQHRAEGKLAARFYDRHLRNPEAASFYHSAEWKTARRIKLANYPVCEECKRVFAQHVHHVKPLAECDSFERIDQLNLMSVCVPCHNRIEAIKGKGKQGAD